MSRHEGVSCDSCLKGNFRGKRYKCLLCYDYDLCAACYEAGASTTRHNVDHPMQCILTRSDFDLYYSGEATTQDHPQSFTCPFCGRMGLTETALAEHVTAEHSESSAEIICPLCAAQPGGEPNHMTDDFPAHLALDHRNRDIDESTSSRHMRRLPHAGRTVNSNRPRRSQMQFTSATGGLTSLSPNSRESMDPIAELLSQLSSVRRSNLTAQSSTTSQLQQLQMQLQMERQQAQMARQQLERLPRRAGTVSVGGGAASASSTSCTTLQGHFTVSLENNNSSPAAGGASGGPQFLLSRCTVPVVTEGQQQALEVEHAERSLFVQELLLNTLGEQFDIEELDSLVKEMDLGAPCPSGGSGTVSEAAAPASPPPASAMPPPVRQQPPNPEPPAAPRANSNNSSNNPRAQNRAAGNSYNNPRINSGSRAGGGRIASQPPNRGPSPTRRKTQRQVEDRNKTTEPPPPH